MEIKLRHTVTEYITLHNTYTLHKLSLVWHMYCAMKCELVIEYTNFDTQVGRRHVLSLAYQFPFLSLVASLFL